MTSIDEIGQVIKYASQLEKLLDSKFSSELESKRISGTPLKGLGDKVKALESHLPDAMRKNLWVIVKIRNNVAHEGSLGSDSLGNYVSRCDMVTSALKLINDSVDRSSLPPQQQQQQEDLSKSTQSPFSNRMTWIFVALTVIVFLIPAFSADAMDYVLNFIIDALSFPMSISNRFVQFLAVLAVNLVFWGILLYILRSLLIRAMLSIQFHIAVIPRVLIASLGTMVYFILTAKVAVWMLEDNHSHGFVGLYLWSLLIAFSYEIFNFNKRVEYPANKKNPVLLSTDLSVYAPRKPDFSFADVQGMALLKTQLLDAVNKHKTVQKNGILFSGDPGNGKTYIAEALAGELKWGFLPISISDIESRWVGQSTEQLKAVFDAASNCGPVVLFFDECDSMLRDRASMMGGTNDESLKKANAFLTGIVDIRRNKNVIVMAASNYRDQLDAAATRDGRFDFKIEIPNPDKEARLGLLNKFSKGVEYEDGVLDRLVKRWEGFSVVRIRSIAEKISDNAKAQGRKMIGVKDAMAALRTIQGSSGAILPDGTPKLEDLRFDQEQRAKLMSLAKRMENIEEVERMGGQVPKGVLFFGPPGTGKTAVAKALAMTSGWAFLPTSGNDLLAGDGNAIDKLIAKARDLRPCIIFIDEAENALGDRATNRYGSAVTNKILSVTDGVNALQDVMFVAATNHPSQLDAAIVRGGRFSEHYEFKKPEEDTVLTMVREWLAERTGSTPFHDEFTPDAAARFLHGHSPADIKDLLQQAVNTGVGRILSGDSAEKKITITDLQAVMKQA